VVASNLNQNTMPSFYKVIPFKEFRKTDKVEFYDIPLVEDLKEITNVNHGPNALSPGSVGDVERPWYMHPHQQDNLIVLVGKRYVDLYTLSHGKVESFEVYPDKIIHNGLVVHDGPAILHWDTHVFHRVKSGEAGSKNINFASHEAGFDIKTNFNIYDLDTESGRFTVVREGHLDQN